MSLEAIRYSSGKLSILDQLLLPTESKYVEVQNTEDGWKVIKNMQVRGAPAIGVVASLSLAVELHRRQLSSLAELATYVKERLAYLVTSRPTAVNIVDAETKLNKLVAEWNGQEGATVDSVKNKVLEWIERLQEEDIAINKAMGKHGAEHILQKYNNDQPINILTHCNTGSLATAGYGTALGVVRALNERGRLTRCYCTETRPYLQGARLTAYELAVDQLPGTLICDDMVAALMQQQATSASGAISAVCVGADRVVANGDTANKIGTYQAAIVARHHNVPFYVVAPSTSIDLTRRSGDEITIEQRPAHEMTHIKGAQIAPTDMPCWNPAFDVTPAELITGGIVTEFGVFSPAELEEKLKFHLAKAQS